MGGQLFLLGRCTHARTHARTPHLIDARSLFGSLSMPVSVFFLSTSASKQARAIIMYINHIRSPFLLTRDDFFKRVIKPVQLLPASMVNFYHHVREEHPLSRCPPPPNTDTPACTRTRSGNTQALIWTSVETFVMLLHSRGAQSDPSGRNCGPGSQPYSVRRFCKNRE